MRARDNPFRVERLHSLGYRAPGFDWSRLLDRLARQGGRGALRGPCGSGKSTLLRQLAPRLEARGLTVVRQRLHRDDPAAAWRQARRLAAGATRGVALLIDGADRVSRWRWRWLRWCARRASVLVATTHVSGRLPTLHRCVADPALLTDLVAELEPGAAPDLPRARRLLRAHDGNVRDVLRHFYDRRSR
jgi:hypothetical protein